MISILLLLALAGGTIGYALLCLHDLRLKAFDVRRRGQNQRQVRSQRVLHLSEDGSDQPVIVHQNIYVLLEELEHALDIVRDVLVLFRTDLFGDGCFLRLR